MDLGSDPVLKLGTFWLISGSGNSLVESVKLGAATDEVFENTKYTPK